MLIRPRGQRHIVITGVVRHFRANPRGQSHHGIDRRQFDFRHNQPGIFAPKFVDFPQQIAVRNVMAGFFDSAIHTQVLQNFFGIRQGNGVFVFKAGNAQRETFQVQPRRITGKTHPNGGTQFPIEPG